MDFTPQDLVRYLQAATGAMPLDGSGIYLITDDKNELIEDLWTGFTFADSVPIASDVRENTPALYLLNDRERCVFCVDTSHVLRLHVYHLDEDEWLERNLEEPHPIIIPITSKLSGCSVPGGQVVVFQDQSGQIQGLQIQSDGGWTSLPRIPDTDSQHGSPHKTFMSDDFTLHVLYLHQDNRIHHLKKALDSETWEEDIAVPTSGMNDMRVTNFMVIPKVDLSFEICALSTEGKLIRIDAAGVKAELGNVVCGKFAATSSQECVIEMMLMIKQGVELGSRLFRKIRDSRNK